MTLTYEVLIQPALWIGLGLGAAFFAAKALRRRRKDGDAKTPTIVAAACVAVALLVIPAVGIVPAGHRGVVYEWTGGVDPEERGEGITFLVPWIQHMRIVSVRTQKVHSDKVFSQSEDLQEITVVASINYHVLPGRASELYQEVGPDYRDTVIAPALFQRTKAAVGQVKAENFAQSRAKLATTIQAQMAAQLSSYGIVVEFVNIEDAIFDPAFVKAVKQKVIADQTAEEQRRLIEAEAALKEQAIIQAEARAQSVKIEAVAQAKANRLIAASLTSGVIRWQWLTRWDGVLPTTLVGGGGSGPALTLLLGMPDASADAYLDEVPPGPAVP